MIVYRWISRSAKVSGCEWAQLPTARVPISLGIGQLRLRLGRESRRPGKIDLVLENRDENGDCEEVVDFGYCPPGAEACRIEALRRVSISKE